MYIPGTTCFAHSSCTSLFILKFIKSTVDCIAHFILFHCTFYSIFYFYFILFYIFFLIFYLTLTYIYIYSLVLCFVFILFFCTVHWADLSWPTFHYWLYPVWLCMWQIIKNLEPWTSPPSPHGAEHQPEPTDDGEPFPTVICKPAQSRATEQRITSEVEPNPSDHVREPATVAHHEGSQPWRVWARSGGSTACTVAEGELIIHLGLLDGHGGGFDWLEYWTGDRTAPSPLSVIPAGPVQPSFFLGSLVQPWGDFRSSSACSSKMPSSARSSKMPSSARSSKVPSSARSSKMGPAVCLLLRVPPVSSLAPPSFVASLVSVCRPPPGCPSFSWASSLVPARPSPLDVTTEDAPSGRGRIVRIVDCFVCVLLPMCSVTQFLPHVDCLIWSQVCLLSSLVILSLKAPVLSVSVCRSLNCLPCLWSVLPVGLLKTLVLWIPHAWLLAPVNVTSIFPFIFTILSTPGELWTWNYPAMASCFTET